MRTQYIVLFQFADGGFHLKYVTLGDDALVHDARAAVSQAKLDFTLREVETIEEVYAINVRDMPRVRDGE